MRKVTVVLLSLVLLSSSAWAYMEPKNGRKAVTSAGTAEAIVAAETLYTVANICAETDNTGVIAVGGSGVIAAAATRTGVPLAVGQCQTFRARESYGDLSKIYVDSTVNGDGVTFNYYFK